MTTDTVFWIASMTKALTSVAAMQQVEQGKLDLDEPIGQRIPELANPVVLEGFDADGSPQLRPARRPITLRHLLSHTAGFTYEIWNADMARYARGNDLPGIIECKNACLTLPLIADPGDRWEYGIGIDWAGKAVELVSGLSLNEYLRTHIFEPLGMADTGFVLRPDQRERQARMHVRTGETSFDVIDFEVPQAPEFFMGGGGLYSTGPDYLRFLRALLGDGALDGARILKPETVAEIGREPDRRPSRYQARDRRSGQLQRRRVLPRHAEEVGPGVHDLHRAGADRPRRRQPGLGRPRQHLLLA